MIAERVEALVIARVHAGGAKPVIKRKAIVDALVRYTPATTTEAAWRERIEQAIDDLRARGTLADTLQLADKAALAHAIGKHSAKTWAQLTRKVLPALGLGVAPDDGKVLGKLAGRDDWTAAIMARVLGLWTGGTPPSLAAACDAYAWRELGLAGKPKRCPAEIRAVFVQRALAVEPGPPDRQVRLFAAQAVGAPRPELAVLLDALVKLWCAGKRLGGRFSDDVRDVVARTRDGVFGDRKVFIASAWDELRRRPPWTTLALADFKSQLVAAHRAGALALARADHVAAIDPALVAASETVTDGASFHFILREAS